MLKVSRHTEVIWCPKLHRYYQYDRHVGIFSATFNANKKNHNFMSRWNWKCYQVSTDQYRFLKLELYWNPSCDTETAFLWYVWVLFLALTAPTGRHIAMCAEVKQLRATAVAQLHFSEFIDFCMLQSVDIMVKRCQLVVQPWADFFYHVLAAKSINAIEFERSCMTVQNIQEKLETVSPTWTCSFFKMRYSLPHFCSREF